MFKKLLAIIMAGIMVLSLCACGNGNITENGDSIYETEKLPQSESKNEAETETEDFSGAALTLTEIICETGLSARNNFEFDLQNYNFLGFVIALAAYEYPYEGVFTRDENGVYHFPEDEIERVAYEVFGFENYKCTEPEGLAFDYDAKKGEFISELAFGIGGGPSVKEPSVTSNGETVTVDFVLTDNKGFAGEPGWTKYGKFRTTFNVIEGENGKFLRFESIENMGLFEPLLIADHIAALNEVFGETFFADFDYYGDSYIRLFSEEQQGTSANAVPDAMANREDLYDAEGSLSYDTKMYDGYYIDTSFSDCYLIENFTSKEEIRGTLRQWLADEIFESDSLACIDENIIEFDGRVFMVRGGRGYGVESCSQFRIISQTETAIEAVGFYYLHGDPAGSIELFFSVDGNRIILESYNIKRSE